MEFEPNRNFLLTIENKFKSLEFYFRTRWMYTGETLRFIRMAQPQERCHLVIEGGDPSLLKVKYTTVCKFMPHYSEFTQKPEKVLCLHLPRTIEEYKATWGSVHYVIADYVNSETGLTTLWYLNAQDMLRMMDEMYKTRSVKLSDGREELWCQQDLISGVPMDKWVEWGIAEIVDTVCLKEFWFQIQLHKKGALLPMPHWLDGKKKMTFINKWESASTEQKTAYWTKWYLHPHKDQSKAVIVSAVGGSKEITYPSMTVAAAALSQLGKAVSIHSLSQCLRGKSKFVNTGLGRVTIRKA